MNCVSACHDFRGCLGVEDELRNVMTSVYQVMSPTAAVRDKMFLPLTFLLVPLAFFQRLRG